MAISATDRCRPARRPDSGFTLMELMVVMVLLALITTLAVPRLGGLVPGMQLDRAATQIGAQLRAARSDAMRGSRNVTVELNAEAQRIRHGDASLPLPSGARLVLPGQQQRAAIVFFPDGSSTGGAFQLTTGSRARSITVDWFNGEVIADARAR